MTIPPAAWQEWEAETFVVQSFRDAFFEKMCSRIWQKLIFANRCVPDA